jgi:hypothetical protein
MTTQHIAAMKLRTKILWAAASLSLTTAAQAGSLCPWDCDAAGGDGTVGISDFLLLLAQWGGPGTCDIDGGGVGITDFLGLLANWGPCPVGGACCNPDDGGCLLLLTAECAAAGGVYGGDGTDCTDTDHDRIPDVFELGDCQPAGACFSGTDPNDADTDDDDIDDGDELYGTLDGLDLPAMGLDPCHQDILIETDWVHTFAQDPDRNKLHINQVTRLVTAFADSGVANPDGMTGINLHIDYGQAPYGGGNSVLDSDGVVEWGNNNEFYDIKDANFAAERHGYFHYCLMADAYSGPPPSPGFAERPGDDFVVSVGQWDVIGDDNRIGNIFMHELGHNLNLLHGGFQNNPNFKPNYNSVMNYLYGHCGTDGDSDSIPDDIADYSHGLNPDLDENLLVEADGVTGVGPPIDWNGDGDQVDVMAQNINCRMNTAPSCANEVRQPSECGTLGECWDSFCSILQDHDDWGSLLLSGINDSDLAGGEVIFCFTDAPALIVGGGRD